MINKKLQYSPLSDVEMARASSDFLSSMRFSALVSRVEPPTSSGQSKLVVSIRTSCRNGVEVVYI